MKLVGATNNFVRIPFLLEGIWLGVFGAIHTDGRHFHLLL